MKPSRSLTIYIASSFRNLHAVHMLADQLREAGHSILDWTEFAPPLPADMRPDDRRAALDSDESGRIFAFCTEACGTADLVIYLGAAGQDSGTEVGIAYNAGVPVYGLSGPLEAPGLILARAVSRWFSKPGELLAAVEEFAGEYPVEIVVGAVQKVRVCVTCGAVPTFLYGDYCALCALRQLGLVMRRVRQS
jgi:hypothetical protein